MKNKEIRKTDIITILLCLVPLLFGAVFYNRLPDKMAVHFDINFSADSFASKNFALFASPLILTALQIICCIGAGFTDEKKSGSKKMMIIVRMIIPIISITLYSVVIGFNLGLLKDAGFIIIVMMSLLFIIIGNYMPKIRANSAVGIRVSWTLNNEGVWDKTHRFAGRLWVITGILLLFTAFFNMFEIALVLIILCGVVIPMIYSYYVYKRTVKEQ